jgi:hypothetical protein
MQELREVKRNLTTASTLPGSIFSLEIIDQAPNTTHGFRPRCGGNFRHVTISKYSVPIVASTDADAGRG